MTSFAKTLSPTPIAADSPREGFNEAHSGKPDQRASEMVRKDHPSPAPRPSLDLAQETDRASFNVRWAEEAREARKAAFKAQRREEGQQSRKREFSRAVTR